MIVGIGTDIIEIDRFASWRSRPYKQLRRIFSHDEIGYALSNPTKAAERFAARFAAREALYKASFGIIKSLPFLSLCAQVSFSGQPARLIFAPLAGYTVHASWSHNESHTVAFVIIEKI